MEAPTSFHVSPGGTHAIYAKFPRLFALPLDGVSPPVTLSLSATDELVEFVDAERILYRSPDGGLFVVPLAGGVEVEVSAQAPFDVSFGGFFDGSVVFLGGAASGLRSLCRVRPDGTGFLRLTPSWEGNGRFLRVDAERGVALHESSFFASGLTEVVETDLFGRRSRRREAPLPWDR